MEKRALSFLLLISITMFCLFADQNLMAPNLSLMAEEFHFNAKERDEKLGGYIAFGFFIVGGPVALIVGYFTDSINRCLLFSVVITIGACASLSTYWVRNYGELFLCRVLTGISIGGVNPVVFSILGDLFPESSRVHVSMVIGISQSSGIAAGQFMAGMIGPRYGWRLPFLLTSMPTLLTGLIVIFALKDPKRGQQERAFQTIQSSSFKNQSLSITVTSNPLHGKDSAAPLVENDSSHHQSQSQMVVHSRGAAEDQITSSPFQEEYLHYSEKIEWEKVKRIFQTPSVVIIFLQGFPGCLPWGMIYVFLNDYLSTNRHMTIEAATITLTSFGVGGIIGQLFGGYFGQKLYNHNPRYQTILMGTSTLLAITPMLLLINIEFSSLFVICFVAFIGGFVINMNGPNVRAVLQNVCVPEVRGTAFAIFALADDIGKGLGPALVVLLIADFQGNRRPAFNVVVMFWSFCGVMLLLLSLTVVHDESCVQERVREAVLYYQTERRREDIDRNDLEESKTNYNILRSSSEGEGEGVVGRSLQVLPS